MLNILHQNPKAQELPSRQRWNQNEPCPLYPTHLYYTRIASRLATEFELLPHFCIQMIHPLIFRSNDYAHHRTNQSSQQPLLRELQPISRRKQMKTERLRKSQRSKQSIFELQYIIIHQSCPTRLHPRGVSANYVIDVLTDLELCCRMFETGSLDKVRRYRLFGWRIDVYRWELWEIVVW